MDYVVYCDESRHDGAKQNAFMAIGGLWVPAQSKPDLTKRLRTLLRSNGINSEFKWSKVSRKHLDAYKRIVDFFFEQGELCFRVILVEQNRLDYEKFHGGDRELGFYKFYYEMLIKWLFEGNQYVILLDFQKNKGARRYTTLHTILDRSLRGKGWIKDLTVIDSSESPLAQMADLLTGAVAADWCGISEGTAKRELAQYIAQRAGHQSLRFETASPVICKINIFRIAV
jgi:hypothetical protein